MTEPTDDTARDSDLTTDEGEAALYGYTLAEWNAYGYNATIAEAVLRVDEAARDAEDAADPAGAPFRTNGPYRNATERRAILAEEEAHLVRIERGETDDE